LLPVLVSRAQDINITPRPVSVSVKVGSFEISPATMIFISRRELEKSAAFFNNYLERFYGFRLSIVTKPTLNSIEFSIGSNENNRNLTHADSYMINVDKTKVRIVGINDTSVFYGMQTLIQLLPLEKTSSLRIPAITIEDYPRFYHRGLMLDCGRHFFSAEFVKQYIDFIALHKMNRFHWHLTEDQGWRIEIKKYPKLTEIGSCRNGTIIGHHPGTGNDKMKDCGYYSQDQIREIVKYAADRYITIIPEIEMPGHSSAAIAAYPQLSCFPDEPTQIAKGVAWAGTDSGKEVQQSWGVYRDVYCPSDYTFKFLEDVMNEVMALFPSKYIHIGGDECPKDNWKRSAFCQNLIREKELKDEDGLQSYFIQQIENYLKSKGRNIIGWDEILEGGLAPNATVMSWRSEQGGINAAKQHHNVIMTPGGYVYFDHSQTKNEDSLTIGGYLPLDKVYNYEPVPKELNDDEAKNVLGAQANIWTEYMSNPSKVEYMIFPRLTALSEVLWSQKENRDWNEFQNRLPKIFKRFELWNINYSKAYYEVKSSIQSTKDNNGVLLVLESSSVSGVPAYCISMNSSDVKSYSEPILIKSGVVYRTVLFDNGEMLGNWITQRILFNKATGKKISLAALPDARYPGSGGAFGLVNGVESERGINSDEWLGWNGTDMEAVIDLGAEEQVSDIQAHILDLKRSQIYAPVYFEAFSSVDGINFYVLGKTTEMKRQDQNMAFMDIRFTPVLCRYIKIFAKNSGRIPDGQPGAHNQAWLFCDEVSVN
jgi:hexosaminidase